MQNTFPRVFRLPSVAVLCLVAVASGSAQARNESSVKLWDVEKGQALRKLKDLALDVRSIAFSPDGGTLAIGSSDGVIVLWNLRSDALRLTLTGHSNSVASLAFSPDGKLLASGSWDTSIRLWDVMTGQSLRLLKAHEGAVLSVVFSADGRLVASGGLDKTVRLWEVASGHELMKLWGQAGSITCVALSSNGKDLVSVSEDNTLTVWDLTIGTVLGKLEGHTGGISSIAFSHDGKFLATGGTKDYSVRIWDIAQAQLLRTLRGHVSSVDSLAFGPDDSTLASASVDQTVTLWDVRSGKELQTLEGHSESVTAVAFSPDGKTVATGSALNLPKKPNLYVVAIGISQYQNSQYDLRYASKDARDWVRSLEEKGRDIFNEIRTRFITDWDATAYAIEKALDEVINKSEPQDAFVFFYEGHTVTKIGDAENELFLVTSDVKELADIEHRALSAAKLRAWVTKIEARNRMLVMAVAAPPPRMSGYISKVIVQNAALQKFYGSNTVVLTGTGPESQQMNNGLLTDRLLRGLEGEADANKDGTITAREVAEFAEASVNRSLFGPSHL